jgi:plastocyanin
MEIPGSPHTLSFQVSNNGATTLQGASRPRPTELDQLRYGFTFTVPLSPGRFLSIFRSPPAPPPLAADAAVRVELRSIAFAPGEVRIKAGQAVEWINLDPVAHTATAEDGSWGSPSFSQNERWTRVFPLPGRYPYYCIPHPQMRGVVIVEP